MLDRSACSRDSAAWSFQATPIRVPDPDALDGVQALPKLAVLQGASVARGTIGALDMQPTQPIHVLRVDDFLAAHFPRVADIVPGLIPGHGVVGLAGPPKARKTNLALALCAATRTGGEFLGLPTRPTRTLFVGEEGSAADLQDRLRKMIGAQTVGEGPNAEMGMAIRQGVRLDTSDGVDRLEDVMASFQPGLLVLDCLVRMHQLNENDARDMARLMETLEALAESHECTVMFLHHVAKMSEGGSGFAMRGSGVLASSTEANLVLRSERGSGGTLRAELREHETMNLKLRFDSPTLLFSALRVEPKVNAAGPSEAGVLAALQETPGMTVAEIAYAVSTSDTTLRPIVSSLVESGAILSTKALRGRGWTYRLAA